MTKFEEKLDVLAEEHFLFQVFSVLQGKPSFWYQTRSVIIPSICFSRNCSLTFSRKS